MSDSLVPKTGVDKNGHPYTRMTKPSSTIKDKPLPGTPRPVTATAMDIINDERAKMLRPQTRYPAGMEWTGNGTYRFFFAGQNREEVTLEVAGREGDWESYESNAGTASINAAGALETERYRSIANAIEAGDHESLRVMTEAKEAAEEAVEFPINFGAMQTIYQMGRFIEDEYNSAAPDVKADALSALVLERVDLPSATPHSLWRAYDLYARINFFRACRSAYLIDLGATFRS